MLQLQRAHSRMGARRMLRCKAQAVMDHRRVAAKACVDRFVRSNSIVGLGSGEMVSWVTEYIGLRLASGALQGVIAIPACGVAAHEAAFNGVPLSTLEQHPQVDVFIDEVEQVDVSANAYVTGAASQPQQPQLQQMRRVLQASKQLVVLADSSNVVQRLGINLPVLIDGEDWETPAEELDSIFLGDAELWRRPTEGSADPRGGDYPYVSEEGHNIVDVRFYESFKLYGEDAPYAAIAAEIEGVAGAVAHGLVVGAADYVLVAHPELGAQVTDCRQVAALEQQMAGEGASANSSNPSSSADS